MRWRWYNIICSLLQQQHSHALICWPPKVMHLSKCNFKIICTHQLRNYSNSTTEKSLLMWNQNGLPVLDVPLPSRNETCQFTLRPVSDSVAHLCNYIKSEDKGIEIVHVYSLDGSRIAGSTSVEHLLLRGSFRLRINDLFYTVKVPPLQDGESVKTDIDKLHKYDDLRAAIASLHAVMNADEYKAFRERKLLEEYERVQEQLKPLVEAKAKIDAHSEKRAQRLLWGTLGAMGFQAGFFARLTWWEYSWDIMEPVTYFATYATLMASFAYYLYTNQSYDYGDYKKRAACVNFYKKATECKFDISRFNELQNMANCIKHDLSRLRDPLYQHLPATRLASLLRENKNKPTASPSKGPKS